MTVPNVLFRGVLELVALLSLGVGPWLLLAGTGPLRLLAALGLPLLAAAAWAVFRTPGDDWDTDAVGAPAREPTVPVPGPVRLALELLLFASAVALLATGGRTVLALALGGSVFVHYLLAHERVRWLAGAKRQEQ